MESQSESKRVYERSLSFSLWSIILTIFVTGLVSGFIVYFWQRSENEKVTNKLKRRISFLEKQVNTLKNSSATYREGDLDISPIMAKIPKVTRKVTQTPTKGAGLTEIKYTLPDGWEARIRPEQNDLFLSPKEGGGFLAIKVYSYDRKLGRRSYYCQLTHYCVNKTYFTPVKIGNISGYRADGLDNSGGGPEYFGAKGDKFYIISTFKPSFSENNFFERTYKQVLDSLVF